MKEREGPWLFSPSVDILVGCGAWSLPLLAITFALNGSHGAAMGFAFYALGLFCNNPHYMATIYRAYRTRSDFAKYRFFTVYVTVLLVATVILLHFAPALVPWVVTLYITWSPWHYTGQNFGIAQLFIRRSGAKPDPVARHLLWASYALSYLGWFVSLHAQRDESDTNFISLGIPTSWAGPLQLLFAATFFICAGFAFSRLSRSVALKALLPAALLTTTQLLWFVLPSLLTRFGHLALPASYFSAGALAFMHCAQYLWITTFYAKKESGSQRFSFVGYYALLVVGGIALFIPGPWIASRLFGHDFVESFLIFMALVNLHHFILDGAIWKLRDGRIARLLLGTQPKPAELDEGQASEHLNWIFGSSRPARILRIGFGAGLLAIAAIDQWQDFLTMRTSDAAALATAQAINPADPRAGFRRAQSLREKGDLDGAERELKRIVLRNPHNGPAQQALGEVLLRKGNAQAALDQYDQMASLFPEDYVIDTNRGVLLKALGNPKLAATRFREAIALAPGHTELHSLLAETLEAAGDLHGSAEEYTRYLQGIEMASQEPPPEVITRYITTAIHLGNLQSQISDTRNAQFWLQKAADLAATRHDFRNAAQALSSLAAVERKVGAYEHALTTQSLSDQAASIWRSQK